MQTDTVRKGKPNHLILSFIEINLLWENFPAFVLQRFETNTKP